MSKHKKKTKTVSIIIPFYGQREKDLEAPLRSINEQIGVDFSKIDVHLVNDGGPALVPVKFDALTNLTIHYHELPENVGPGLARQYGIDHSDSEYIMFMDADDKLYGPKALLAFFWGRTHYGDRQVFIASFTEQENINFLKKKNQEVGIYKAENDAAVYAKWYSRRFLKKMGLRFSSELRYFEDSYFVGLVMLFATEVVTLETPVYIWMRRSGSISRSIWPSEAFVTMQRLRLEMIVKKRPDLMKVEFDNAIANIYMNYTDVMTKIYDKRTYDVEFQKLITQFSNYWTGYTTTIQKMVEELGREKGGLYEGVETEGLEKFLNKFDEEFLS